MLLINIPPSSIPRFVLPRCHRSPRSSRINYNLTRLFNADNEERESRSSEIVRNRSENRQIVLKIVQCHPAINTPEICQRGDGKV